MINTNDPVIAIHSIEDNIVYIYGYGIYKDSPVNTDIHIGKANIELDSGENISDLECLWGNPDALLLTSKLRNRKIYLIDANEVRKTEDRFNWQSYDLGQIN
jgi:hypothetical protein